MTTTKKKQAVLLFLLGAFSMTQVNLVGYIGISELVCYLTAPFLLSKHLNEFRRWGLMPYLMLLVLWVGFALVTDWIHDQDAISLLKGIAPIYSYFSVFICAFVLLRRDLSNFRWVVIGFVCSMIISTFIFQPGSGREVDGEVLSGIDAIEAVVGYKLYWVALVSQLFQLPIKTAFLTIPLTYSLGATAGNAVFSLFSGGRSSFAIQTLSVFLLFWGRAIRKPGFVRPRSLFSLLLPFLGIVAFVSIVYKLSVKKGWLGEVEVAKYEQQTKKGSSPLQLLMAGRGEFFIGFIAACDAPVLGHGSKAIDLNGYRLDFLSRYGDEEDWRQFMKILSMKGSMHIPAHSHIIQAWMWHGLGGLLFWLYVFWICFRTFQKNIFVYPPFFGYFALVVPGMLAAILFSPMGNRAGTAFTILCCLMANKIGEWKRRGVLPANAFSHDLTRKPSKKNLYVLGIQG